METIEVRKVRWVVASEAADLIPKSRRQRSPWKRISQSTQILRRAELRGYKGIRRVGKGVLIDQPLETNGWLVMPRAMYKGAIPDEAVEQARRLTDGIPIKGFLIAEDLRCLETQHRAWDLVTPASSTDWGAVAAGAGKVAIGIAIGAAVLMALPLILGLGAAGAVLTYDPLLIAVTDEDEWVAVAEWWDEPPHS